MAAKYDVLMWHYPIVHTSHIIAIYACFATEIERHSSTHSLLHEDQLQQCFSVFQHQFSFIDQTNAPFNVIWHLKNVQESNQILLYLPRTHTIAHLYLLHSETLANQQQY